MSAGALPRPTELAHQWVRRVVRPGDVAVDATVGNGHDTEVLARLVGPTGRVIGFDLQEEAIEATRRRLEGLGGAAGVGLFWESLAGLGGRVPDGVAAVMFNLGYLPGGDHAVITETAETLAALDAAWGRLRVGGLITVVCYPGHAGGDDEAAAVVGWAEGLGGKAEVARYGMVGTKSAAPMLVAVLKQESGGSRRRCAMPGQGSQESGD